MSQNRRKAVKKTKKGIISFLVLISIGFFGYYLFKPYQKPLEQIDKTYQKEELNRLQQNVSEHIKITDIFNGKIIALPFLVTYGNPHDPFLQQLNKKEQLNVIVKDNDAEIEKFVQLREWAYNRWKNRKITIWHPFNAIAILNAVDNGYGGFCAHYAIVYVQAALSLGYQSRYLDINDHYLLEIWSNHYNKWIVMDPFNDCYYAWKGIPMSAFDIHEKVLENKKDMITVVGNKIGAGALGMYNHIAVVIRNNHYTYKGKWDHTTEGYFKYLYETRNKYYLSWKDKTFKEDFFMSKGRRGMFGLFTSDLDVFNWKINQIKIEELEFNDTAVTIHYTHNAPYWQYTEINTAGAWSEQKSSTTITVPLKKGKNIIHMRTVNCADVKGPVFYLELVKN